MTDQEQQLRHALSSVPDPGFSPGYGHGLAERARGRRKKRRTISSVIAGTVIAAGISVAIAGSNPSQINSMDAADQSGTPSRTQRLTVTVDTLTTLDGDLALYYARQRYESSSTDTARWEPDTRLLTYIPQTMYTTCLPVGEAESDGESVDLSLTVTGTACRLISQSVSVTISGLAEAPSELFITEDGETRTVPVVVDGDGANPGEMEDPAVLDSLTYALELGTLTVSGYLPSTITVTNGTEITVVDPGCRATSNFSFGVVPVGDPNAPLSGRVMTKCGGPSDLEPGSAKRLPGPAFDARRLPPGEYLAVLDFGSARSTRLTTSLDVP